MNSAHDQANPVTHVAIGALIRPGPEGPMLLITKRQDNAVLGGLWELPGGKVEPGETPEQCLRREFLEEVDLHIAPTTPLAPIDHLYEHAAVRLHPYLCHDIERDPRSFALPRNIGVAEHRWVLAEDLGEYPFPSANSELMQRLARHLAGHEDAAAQSVGPQRQGRFPSDVPFRTASERPPE